MLSTLLADYAVVVEIPIAWGEMDAYAHVNNVVYFRYFETARMAYFRRLGWEAGALPKGVGPIVATAEARFRKPLAYPDTVSVGVRAADLAADRFVLEYAVVSHSLQAVAALGKTTVVSFDYGAGTKAALPEEIRRRIEELEATGRRSG